MLQRMRRRVAEREKCLRDIKETTEDIENKSPMGYGDFLQIMAVMIAHQMEAVIVIQQTMAVVMLHQNVTVILRVS